MKRKYFSVLLMGALTLASTSTFTSCKDYDDDITANANDIANLKTELSTVKTNLENELTNTKSALETQITQTKEALQEAIAKKADAATVTALETKVTKLETDLAAAEARLQTQIDAANTAIDNAKNDIAGVKTTLEALTGQLKEEKDAREAVEKNLEIQTKALESFQEKVGNDNKALKEQIDALKEKVNGMATDGTVKELQTKVNALSTDITKLNENVDALTVLVQRALSSIALVPSLYVDGIETIEFQSVAYTPVQPGTSGATYVTGAKEIRIDNGLTEATYRLNPTTVQRDGIDENNIEFKAAIAETRAANILENSPVQFNGIKDFKDGLMTVYVKKSPNFTSSLASAGDNKIYIVSLKVPRNSKKYEAADIYSENSRLSETTITPRIAVLPWENHSVDALTDSYKYHYSDSATIWGSRVSASPNMIVKQIYYKDATNLQDLVTGCYDRKTGSHNQITKEQLKKYGLTFRFAIPTKAYNNGAENGTDQQKFASVTPEGILTSKTPAGVTNNEAVVGKEPIIRVDLVDSVHNKLVDQRYMKVQWTLQEKPEVTLDIKGAEATLSCNDVKASITWDEFVNEVYAKARLEGISQNKFETIYKASDIAITQKGFTTNWNPTAATSAKATGSFTKLPVMTPSTNKDGDATIGEWTLSPEDIETVYCSSANDTKTFTAEVKFKSSMPSEYPDLKFNWTFTIKLPALPAINGYYDQYWTSVGKEHDVLPVQWNTDAQTKAYCVYDNNLMNAFTYELKNNVRQFIVKNMPECGTWDLQFSFNQATTGYAPNYTTANANAWKSANQWTNIESANYSTFAGYQLMNGSNKALQLNWDEGHTSWCGSPAHKTCNLFADHNTPANQGLLNELASTDVTGSDGTVTPGRTHTKAINMTVWATLNGWNYIPVLNYKIYLVAPIRINSANSLGKFQDGVASGDVLDWTKSFTLTDFRGYLVANTADGTFQGEQKKYTESLWKYYEIKEVKVDEDNIRYTFEKKNGSVKPNTSLSYASSLTAKQIKDETNGNITLSMSQVGANLIFKNNGGSNIEENVKAYIPVTVTYGFGKLTAYVTVDIVPHGHK